MEKKKQQKNTVEVWSEPSIYLNQDISTASKGHD